MLIFDQLKKDDPQLRLVAIIVLGSLGVLLGGLWWVQVVSARDYQANLETQSFRTVRIPAVRGKILDRNGIALAENRPSYNVSLYLEELRRSFETDYVGEAVRARAELKQQQSELVKKLNRKLTKEERRQFRSESRRIAQIFRDGLCRGSRPSPSGAEATAERTGEEVESQAHEGGAKAIQPHDEAKGVAAAKGAL